MVMASHETCHASVAIYRLFPGVFAALGKWLSMLNRVLFWGHLFLSCAVDVIVKVGTYPLELRSSCPLRRVCSRVA
ncbi:hypothetical protein BJ138DRAFT_1139482 [Hygrophoropsis aurantiaca]|uniref:Uncharacterized protein n=1 Tax=Hygrophoropsis aurantiaca TaxID=72124 RepID=A0ACB8AW39_9AGAM|nr:hypothetical protein BJ138DRAFT_1139482 [Hygrophoropsis aurantiaca]